MSNLLQELKRRKVFQVGVAYAITAWGVAQVAELGLSSFGAPDWVMKSLLLLMAVGLLAALILAWVFERTSEGIRFESDATDAVTPAGQTSWRLNALIIGMLAVALTAFFLGRFAGDSEAPAHATRMGPGSEAASQSQAKNGAVTIAVLPFVNMSDDAANEYFSDGISEELLNLLAHVNGLQVTSRTSSFAFKGRQVDLPSIARQLGVDHILEGSVRKAGDQVRITAQLINVKTDSHLWSETYTRKLDDVFLVQDEISSAIASVLELKLGGVSKQPVPDIVNVAAHDAYLQARFQMNQRSGAALEIARAKLEQAVSIDPGYALAQSALADTYMMLSDKLYGTLDEAVALSIAKTHIDKALELDPELGEAHASMGLYLQMLGKLPEAESSLETAIQLNPGNAEAYAWLSSVLNSSGKYEERFEILQRGVALDPLHPRLVSSLAGELFKRNQPEQGRAMFMRLIEYDPTLLQPVQSLSANLLYFGDVLGSLEWAQRGVEIAPEHRYAYVLLIDTWAVALGDEARAAKWLNVALEKWPLDSVLLYLRQEARLRNGEHEAALDFFRTELRNNLDRDPEATTNQTLQAYYELGVSESWAGNFAAAARYLDKAFAGLESEPDTAPVDYLGLERLAFARIRSGDSPGAESVLNEILRRLEVSTTAVRRDHTVDTGQVRGTVLAMKGELEMARESFSVCEISGKVPSVYVSQMQKQLEDWLAEQGIALSVSQDWESCRTSQRDLALAKYP